MFQSNRFIAASLLGFLFGFVCLALASSSPGELPAAVGWQLVFSRALIGFAIGISNIKALHWALHGSLIGAVFSIPLAFSGLMAPDSPEYDKTTMFIFTILLGMIYGLLIDLFATKLFKPKPVAAS